jgi:hypothetical protein
MAVSWGKGERMGRTYWLKDSPQGEVSIKFVFVGREDILSRFGRGL